MLIGSCKQLVGCYLIILIEQHSAILGVVDVGTYLIHTVGWLDGNNVINAWLAETAVGQVDSLVATIAQEDVVCGHSLDLAECSLKLQLQWVGVAVERLIVWILVSIEKHASLPTSVLIASAAVRR